VTLKKFSNFLLVFTLLTVWVFSDWIRVLNFPPEIQKAHAALPSIKVEHIDFDIGVDGTATTITDVGSFDNAFFRNNTARRTSAGPQGFVNESFRILTQQGITSERIYFEACYPEDEQAAMLRKAFAQDDPSRLSEKASQTGGLGFFFQGTQQTTNHVIFTNRNGTILYANAAAENMTGYTLSEMLGQTPRLWGGLMPAELFKEVLWSNIQKGVSARRAFINRHKDGHLYVAIGIISPIFEGDVISGYVATEVDITTLREIDRAKSEFVSLASHQLRTPLSTINWYAEMLENGDAGPLNEKQHEFLKEISIGSERMVVLVNALLNVSRLELGHLSVNPSPTDLTILAKAVIGELRPIVEKNHLTVIENYEEGLPKINVDPKLISIVFQNLLTNSVKYTKESGNIEVSIGLRRAGDVLGERGVSTDSVLVMVKDNGIGIPENKRNAVFTKLFRADNARERDQDGTGLGLYIVKEIVNLVGGSVWYDSKVDVGTTFYVLLPLAGMKKSSGVTSLK
jgi:PAS domain S-box-containing protein